MLIARMPMALVTKSTAGTRPKPGVAASPAAQIAAANSGVQEVWEQNLPEPTLVLTKAQIASFRQNGFLTVPKITTDEELQLLRAEYDMLFESQAGRDVGRLFDLGGTDGDDESPAVLPQLLDPQVYAPRMRNTLYEANALACAQQLIGPTAEYMLSHAICKPPMVGAATPWHQDEGYAPPEVDYGRGGGFGVVNSWMPLQDVTVESGCMQFVPWVNGKQPEVMAHHHLNHDPRIHGLELDDLSPTKNAVACPMPAGGATFHVMRTLHYSGPNLTAEPRRAFILKFAVPGAASPVDDPPPRPWQQVTTPSRGQELRQAAAKKGVLVGAARAVLSNAGRSGGASRRDGKL